MCQLSLLDDHMFTAYWNIESNMLQCWEEHQKAAAYILNANTANTPRSCKNTNWYHNTTQVFLYILQPTLLPQTVHLKHFIDANGLTNKTSTIIKSHHQDFFWHYCQNNIQICWKPALHLLKNSSNNCFFPSLNTSSVSLLFFFFSWQSLTCFQPMPWWETSSFIQIALSASYSLCLRQCLNVNEFASLTSLILLPLTHRTALLIISKPGVEPGVEPPGSDPLSAARRFAKSIAANEGLDKRKPQYKLNKLG